MIGILAYLSTTVFFPSYIILMVIPIFTIRLIRNSHNYFSLYRNPQIKIGEILLIISALLALLIFVAGMQSDIADTGLSIKYPYLGLIFISCLLGKVVNNRDLLFIIILFSIESLVGILEYVLEVKTFFKVSKDSLGETGFGESELLYYNRVFGISDNSSTFAFKGLIVLFILYLNFGNIIRNRFVVYFVSALVIVTLFITFNRTTIIATMGFLFLIANRKFKILGLITFVLFIILFYQQVIEQLFRGMDGGDTSGRAIVFMSYYEFIKDNLLFGNYGVKLWLLLLGKIFHAHNSFLELFASNGLLVSIIFLAGFYTLTNKRSLPIIITLSVYSLIQYGLFWGFTFNDIITFGLIFYTYKANGKRYNEE